MIKYFKIGLLVALAICFTSVIYLKTTQIVPDSNDSDTTEVAEEVELNYDDSKDESSSTEIIASDVSYKVVEDGITYNFMFETPTNYEDIIKGINNTVDEEFDSCDIFYPEESDGTYQYDVVVNNKYYTVFLTE